MAPPLLVRLVLHHAEGQAFCDLQEHQPLSEHQGFCMRNEDIASDCIGFSEITAVRIALLNLDGAIFGFGQG